MNILVYFDQISQGISESRNNTGFPRYVVSQDGLVAFLSLPPFLVFPLSFDLAPHLCPVPINTVDQREMTCDYPHNSQRDNPAMNLA